MSSQAAQAYGGELTPFEQLRYGREIIELEAESLRQIASRLGTDFCEAVSLVLGCRGCVIVAGMGKAGLIGQKITATLASTGTRSHFVHPAEAVHGDLGRVHEQDVVLMLSASGETEEVVRLLPLLQRMCVPIIAVTRGSSSTLGRSAAVTLELGPLKEAGALGLAPSTTTTAMLALGDALALVTSRMRRFTRLDFARYHPGGSLGRSLSKVDDLMRPRHACRIANQSHAVRDVFVEVSFPGRRSGAIMLVDPDGRLTGLFTDSDLARLFEDRRDSVFDRPIQEVMTREPCSVLRGSWAADAVDVMAQRKISELPVVDRSGAPVGLIDITDVVGMIPEESD